MTCTTKFSLSAAALAVALPGAVLADAHQSATEMTSGRVTTEILDSMLRSSNLIGGTVYTMAVASPMSGDAWTDRDVFTEVDGAWETLGTVEDVVLSRDGQLTGFVVEDTGFLGFGDDFVLIEMSAMRMVDDGTGDHAWVTNISQDSFEAMPEVDENWY